MFGNWWHKKEKPLLGLMGMGGGVVGGLTAGAVSTSGGTIVDSGSRVWHVMMADEDFVAAKDLTNVEILLIGGGGGGQAGAGNDSNAGGGGGAGGYLHVSAFTLSKDTYTVTVGGGAGPGSPLPAPENTQFPHPYGNLIAYGGGSGGSNPGGSGGGGKGFNDPPSNPVAGGPASQPGWPTGSWPGPITITIAGSNGGAGEGSEPNGAAGGGGGAGGTGSNRSGDNGGAGGSGKPAPTSFPAPEIAPAIPSTATTQGGSDPTNNNIRTDWLAAVGPTRLFAGGGGGGGNWYTSPGYTVHPGNGGAPGTGGGGRGGYGPNQHPSPEPPNSNTNPYPKTGFYGIQYTGGGGGGGAKPPGNTGSSGGSGICIVTYPTSQ